MSASERTSDPRFQQSRDGNQPLLTGSIRLSEKRRQRQHNEFQTAHIGKRATAVMRGRNPSVTVSSIFFFTSRHLAEGKREVFWSTKIWRMRMNLKGRRHHFASSGWCRGAPLPPAGGAEALQPLGHFNIRQVHICEEIRVAGTAAIVRRANHLVKASSFHFSTAAICLNVWFYNL